MSAQESPSHKLLYDYGMTVDSIAALQEGTDTARYSRQVRRIAKRVSKTGIVRIPGLPAFRKSVMSQIQYLKRSPDINGEASANLEEAWKLLTEAGIYERASEANRSSQGDPSDACHWVRKLSEAHEVNPYDFLLWSSPEADTCERITTGKTFLTATEMENSEKYQDAESAVTTDRNEEQVSNELRLFASVSRSFKIIDPYVLKNLIGEAQNTWLSDTGRRWADSLKSIDRVLFEERHTPKKNPLERLEIHTWRDKEVCCGRGESYPTRKYVEESGVLNLIADCMAQSVENCTSEVTLHLWECPPGKCRPLHDRWLLSGGRGITIPRGVDYASDREEEIDLKLMGQSERERYARRTNPNQGYFGHVDSWPISLK